MSDDNRYKNEHELFDDADARFKETMSAAFTAHAKCVAAFHVTLTQVRQREDELKESVEELKRLLLEGK